MTKEDLIAMAGQADLWLTSDERIAAVQRFASLVSARTREECAKVCDQEFLDAMDHGEGVGARSCARLIRAMGERT